MGILFGSASITLLALMLTSYALAQPSSIAWMRSGHFGVVNAIAFSPITGELASVADDGLLRIFDPVSGELKRAAALESAANCLAYTAGGTRLLVGCYDGFVRLLDASTLTLLRVHRAHESIVFSISATADGSRYTTAGESVIRIWNGESGELVSTLTGHPSTVKAAAITPDGRFVISGGTDYTVRLWDALTGQQIKVVVEVMKPVSAVAVSSDSRFFAARGYSMDIDTFSVNIYRLPDGELVKSFEVNQRKDVVDLDFTPDGSGIVSISMDIHKGAREYHTIEVNSIEGARGKWSLFDTLEGSCAAFSPDGRWFAYGTYGGWIAVVPRCSEPTCWMRDDSLRRITEYYGQVGAVALSPDEGSLAVGSEDGRVELRDARTGVRRLVFEGHRMSLRSLTFSADGSRLASAATDGAVKLWETETGTLQRRFYLSSFGAVREACLIDRDRGLAGALGPPTGTIVLLDTSSNDLLAALGQPSLAVNAIALSNDGLKLIAGDDGGAVRTWDLSSRTEIYAPVVMPRAVRSVEVSRTDMIVAGCDDGTLALIELGSAWPIWTDRAHTDAITSIDFSRDGNWVATCSLDSTVKVWRVEAEALALMHEYRDWPFPHYAVTISSDAGLVIAGTSNSTVVARHLYTSSGAAAPLPAATGPRILPNPARRSATLVLDLRADSHCLVHAVDPLGRRTLPLVDRYLVPGSHRLHLDLSALSAGAWFVEITTPEHRSMLALVKAPE